MWDHTGPRVDMTTTSWLIGETHSNSTNERMLWFVTVSLDLSSAVPIRDSATLSEETDSGSVFLSDLCHIPRAFVVVCLFCVSKFRTFNQ